MRSAWPFGDEGLQQGLSFIQTVAANTAAKIFSKCSDHGMLSSMSRKGDCWDNSVAESFFGSLKTERVYDTTYSTREQARGDIVDYIEMFYNSKRRHSYLGYLSPRESEKMMALKIPA